VKEERLKEIFELTEYRDVCSLIKDEQWASVYFYTAVEKIFKRLWTRKSDEIINMCASKLVNHKIQIGEDFKEIKKQLDDIKWRITMLEEKLKEK
jgi:hypothetical protein